MTSIMCPETPQVSQLLTSSTDLLFKRACSLMLATLRLGAVLAGCTCFCKMYIFAFKLRCCISL